MSGLLASLARLVCAGVFVLLSSSAALAQPPDQATPRLKLRPHREPVRADRAEAKIEAKMNDPVAVDFRDFPLKDALEYLDSLQSLRLQYDQQAIREAGVRMDQPITLNLKDIPLRAMFKLLLEPVQMEWIIRDGSVVVTTASVAGKHPSSWKYDINDLVAAGIPVNDFAAVVRGIVAPRSWEAAGPGSLVPAETTLVVRQTPPVHHELQRLLRDIRRQLSETEAQRRDRQARQMTTTYDVTEFIDPMFPPEKIIEALADEVFRATWERFGGRGKIALNEQSLEVTNDGWVHARLATLFERVREMGLEEGRNGATFNFASALQQAGYTFDDGDVLDGALRQLVSIEFSDTMFWDALRRIREFYGVFCHIPDDDTAKAATKRAMHVTKTFRALPLSSALDELLTPFKLDWYVTEHATVNVIGAEQAAARRDLRVFRIVELIEAGHRADQLVKKITETIEPTSWQTAGGTATIHALPGVLLVRHNRRTQERIARFLESSAGK
jgi:hypothetical protein